MTGQPEKEIVLQRARMTFMVLADMWRHLEDSGWSGKMVIDVHRNAFVLHVSNGRHTHLIEAQHIADFIGQFLLTFPEYSKRFSAGDKNGDPSTAT